MVLVGAAATGSILALTAGSAADPGWLRRLAFRSFLIVAVPAYIVMRIGAEWLYEKEFGDSGRRPAVDRDRLHHGRRRARSSS